MMDSYLYLGFVGNTFVDLNIGDFVYDTTDQSYPTTFLNNTFLGLSSYGIFNATK